MRVAAVSSADLGVIDRITMHAERLTPAERKVAEILAGEPQTVAFGTVAQVAQRAGTSGPSVVRLAVKLGYGGFVDLQADVQDELARQLGPARDRIRQRPPSDVVGRTLAAECDNVSQTLSSMQPATFKAAVDKLSDRRRHVFILPGDMTLPAGSVLATQLSQLRDGVSLLAGSEVAVSRRLATLEPADVLVAIDMRRYERWLLNVLRQGAAEGALIVAITDSPLSPLASMAAQTFLVAAQGVGPFDSLIGALALVNALIAGVAARLRQSATSRLDAIESAWGATGALVSGAGPGAPPAGPADNPDAGAGGSQPAVGDDKGARR